SGSRPGWSGSVRCDSPFDGFLSVVRVRPPAGDGSARGSGPPRADRSLLQPLEFLLPVEVLDALGDPGRRVVALEVVPEPLEDAAVVVELVRALGEGVVLAFVDEEDHLLAGAAGGVVELDPLVPVDRAVLVAERDEERRVHALEV